MTDQKTIDRYVAEALAYDVPAEIDYEELCKENYPDDLFMMEGCESRREREDRYATIVSMNRAMRRGA